MKVLDFDRGSDVPYEINTRPVRFRPAVSNRDIFLNRQTLRTFLLIQQIQGLDPGREAAMFGTQIVYAITVSTADVPRKRESFVLFNSISRLFAGSSGSFSSLGE